MNAKARLRANAERHAELLAQGYFVPERGVDPMIDTCSNQVWDAITTTGNPELLTREQADLVLCARFTELGGKHFKRES